MTYPIFEVTGYERYEPLGTKQKFWFRDQEDVLWLFKAGRPGTGENWSEKATCELAKLMGLPCTDYELAIWGKLAGVVAPSFIPAQGRLALGNEVLARVLSGYEPTETYTAREYRLTTVCALLSRIPDVNPPIGSADNVLLMSPLQVFIGYLIFDCWIGNPDRHHENWGFVVTSDTEIHLLPTFDHASGLGVRLRDSARWERLTTKDSGYGVESYVRKARTPFRGVSGKKMFTLDVVQELARRDAQTVTDWLTKIARIMPSQIEAVFELMPEDALTPVEAEFAMKMLHENKCRMESL